MSQTQIEDELIHSAQQLQEKIGGCDALVEIREQIASLKKAVGLEHLFSRLNQLFFREAVYWKDVKDLAWSEEVTQEKNHFPFLQGDLLISELVLSLSKFELGTNHWLVLESTCGATRRPFISVAPAIPILSSYKTSKDTEHQKMWNNLMWSLKLRGGRFFPYPAYEGIATPDVVAFLCQLDAPFFLEHENRSVATPIRSMSYPGWLIFKAFLEGTQLRVNLEEEKIFRSAPITD